MGIINLNKQDIQTALNQIEKELNGNLTKDNLVNGAITNDKIGETAISGLTETTLADVDYLMVWDATDSTLKKVVASEFGGQTTSWLGPGNLFIKTGSSADYVTVSGIPYIAFDDATEEYMMGSVIVPTGKTGISSIKVYYLNEEPSLNLVLYAQTNILVPATAVAANQDATLTDRAYTTPANDNYIEAITLNADVTNELSAFSAGQIFSFHIGRKGAAAADTYGAVWRVLGVLITWS